MNWRSKPKPQQTWTAVFDDNGGLAVISAGLCESAVQDLPDRPIALTLVRATRRTVFTDGEPNGQIQGNHTFRYWLAPLAGAPERGHLCRLGQRIDGGLRAVCLDAEDIYQYEVVQKQPYGEPQTSDLLTPVEGGFLAVEGSAIVTSLRHTPQGVEIRMFNPDAVASDSVLRLGAWPGQQPRCAQAVDFEGKYVGSQHEVCSGSLRLSLGAKKILTLRLV